MARSAEVLHAAGVRHANAARFAPARRDLEAALQAADDPDLRARIAGTLAWVLTRTGDLAAGERLCLDALAAPGLAPSTVAVLAGQMGSIAEQAGRLNDAERWLTRAIETESVDSTTLGTFVVNRTLVNIHRRRLDEATADAAWASAIFSRVGQPVDQAEARHNEGYVALLRGDLVAALSAMAEARGVLAAQSPALAAVCDADRAEVLRDAGLTGEAEKLLGRAAAVFGQHRMKGDRAQAEFHLARSLLLHDPARAGTVAATAARRFRAVGNEAGAARAEALRMRAALVTGRRQLNGRPATGSGAVPRRADVDALADALNALGFASEGAALRLSHELWCTRSGTPVHGGARRIRIPPTASLEVRLLAYEARAERAAARGRPAEARRTAAAGLGVLERRQGAFGSLDLQTSATMHANGLLGLGLASAVGSGRPDTIFDWSERARHLSMQVIPLRPPPDGVLADALAELRMLRAEGGDWLASPRAAALQDAVRERQWSGTGSAAIQRPLGLEDARMTLDDDTAIIAYVFSGALHALVVTRDGTHLMPIPQWQEARDAVPGLRADLDVAAAVRSGPMAAVVRRTLDDRLAHLSRLLFDAPAAAAGARRLVLTVPGLLSGIPWAMLPGARGRVITLATSVTRWAGSRTAVARIPSRAGFAVGPRVLRGDEEVAAAASSWSGAGVLRGDDASVADVSRLADEVDLLHVAAHGRHAADNPLFSGLELADGTLFGYDLDLIDRVPGTVVLSACEVGRSSVRWGEEAVGMTRTWLHAGAHCVVAAPVVVADDDACELLGAMHEELAEKPPAEALAVAAERTGIIAPFQAHGAGF